MKFLCLRALWYHEIASSSMNACATCWAVLIDRQLVPELQKRIHATLDTGDRSEVRSCCTVIDRTRYFAETREDMLG